MAVVNVSDKVAEDLQRLAQTENLSLDELLEGMITHYGEDYFDEPSDEEIEAVRAAVVEADKPGAETYSQEEVEAHIYAFIASKYKSKILSV